MKKCIEIIVSVFVLAIGLALPVAAQDATYSCGAYGAGDYSTNDCATSGGGGDSGGSSGQTGTSGSGAGSGSSSGGQGANEGADTGTTDDEAASDPEARAGFFEVIFAKLASSWGWVSIFVVLLIAGVVLIGVTRRKHDRD